MTEKKLGPYQALKHEGTYKIGADKPDIDFKQIGKRGVRRYDGFEKASGKALYTRSVSLPGMLYAKVLASPLQGPGYFGWTHARRNNIRGSDPCCAMMIRKSGGGS